MKVLLTVLLALSVTTSFAQQFPDDWIGNYSGKMIIGNLRPKAPDTVDVKFELATIEKDLSWSYKMTFISTKFGTVVKDYKIVADTSGNTKKFVLDENNGIKMNLSLMDGTFYGMYEVMGMMYISTIQYLDGDLYYDLFAAAMDSATVTATPKTEEEESIEATSYETFLHQTVLLKRDE